MSIVNRIKKKIGYARVSTTKQELHTQVEALEQEGCTIIYTEKYTGTKLDRPELQKALSQLEEGDTLVVTKLDRLARSAKDAIEIVRGLFEKGIKVHILNMGIVENTPTGRLVFTIMSAFAEFERDMIVERTQEGKAYAKENNPNFKEGRPKKFSRAQVSHALKLVMEDNYTYPEVVEMTGISKTTLLRERRKLLAKQQA